MPIIGIAIIEPQQFDPTTTCNIPTISLPIKLWYLTQAKSIIAQPHLVPSKRPLLPTYDVHNKYVRHRRAKLQ